MAKKRATAKKSKGRALVPASRPSRRNLPTKERSYPPGSSLVGDRGRWWWPLIHEPYTGAWQRNEALTPDTLLTNSTIYACLERISSDVGKCRIRLVEQDSNDIWNETYSAAFSPVLTKPNHYQTRIQFFENWVLSKLLAGNTYVLKGRDARGVVTELYVLNPYGGVWPLVTPSGDVYYELCRDYLAGIDELRLDRQTRLVVPASEIIHDMCTIKWHPLCGISPLIAASNPAYIGMEITKSSGQFFKNKSTPGGVLTAAGEIKEATARRLKEYWETEFGGENSGKIAVLGDGLKFEPMNQTALNSQLVEQLGLSAQQVCSAFGVPAFMVGVGPMPQYNNIEGLNQQYYSQCLQKYFESIELLMDEGLGLTQVPNRTLGTEFDLDDLLRMLPMTMIEAIDKAVKAGVMKPNEGRKRLNYEPVEGGDACYLQQQNFSLSALAKRDAKPDPFGGAKPPGSSFGGGGGSGGGAPAGEGDTPDPAPTKEMSMADLEIARARVRLAIETRAVAA